MFVPAVPDNVRIVLAGREPPVSAWLTAWNSPSFFRPLPLGPLDEVASRQILRDAGTPEDRISRINRIARGHPLALRLGSAALVERPDLSIEDAALPRVVGQLTQIFLQDVRDPLTREALEAASVVRRVTLPLLRALLPESAPRAAYDRLASLSFVESSRDGLLVHDLVQGAIATSLRAADPVRHRAYRRAAWQHLASELQAATRAELWRYTADLLFICENVHVREAFFPTGAHSFAIEPARAVDGEAIEAIIRRHEGPRVGELLTRWWRHAPQTFRVVRDSAQSVAGFHVPFDPTTVPQALFRDDPLFGRWWHHLRTFPVDKGECVLFNLRWLSRDEGEAPSPIQATCWLDIKASYMQVRPHLRRIYMVVCDLETYGPIAQQLGHRLLPDGTVELDGRTYYSAMLDFGPSSIDGWLRRLVANELGAETQELLDRDGHELVLDGLRVQLSPLEFKVLDYLDRREGKAITRAALPTDVWGYEYDGGSNVVDAVIRGLRKKLGPRAARIETITGTGYRLRKG